MPKQPSQSKFISKLIEQTKSDATTIKAQKAKLDKADEERQKAVQAAIDATAAAADQARAQLIASHQTELAKLKAQHDEDWKHAAERQDAQLRQLSELSAKVSKLEGEASAYKQEIDNLTVIKTHQEGRIAELETQLDTLKPELALLETKREELTKLCDKVRDRMKRREREEEQAILNRKAVSSALPGWNRGR